MQINAQDSVGRLVVMRWWLATLGGSDLSIAVGLGLLLVSFPRNDLGIRWRGQAFSTPAGAIRGKSGSHRNLVLVRKGKNKYPLRVVRRYLEGLNSI